MDSLNFGFPALDFVRQRFAYVAFTAQPNQPATLLQRGQWRTWDPHDRCVGYKPFLRSLLLHPSWIAHMWWEYIRPEVIIAIPSKEPRSQYPHLKILLTLLTSVLHPDFMFRSCSVTSPKLLSAFLPPQIGPYSRNRSLIHDYSLDDIKK